MKMQRSSKAQQIPMFALVLLSLFGIAFSAQLSIWSPQELAAHSRIGNLVAPIGIIPMETINVVEAAVHRPEDACTNGTIHPTQEVNNTVTAKSAVMITFDPNSGDCSIETKISNAMKHHPLFIIVVDTSIEDIMVEDNSQFFGTPGRFKIPVIVVGRTALNFMKYVNSDKNHNHPLTFYANFGQRNETTDKHEHFELFFSAWEERSWQFLSQLHDALFKTDLHKFIHIHPRFVSVGETECDGGKCNAGDCLGSVCLRNVENKKSNNSHKTEGNHVLAFHEYMHCAWPQHHEEKNWKFALHFYKTCFKRDDFTPDCITTAMNETGIKREDVEVCIHAQEANNHTALREDHKRFTMWHSIAYPTIVNHEYRYHDHNRNMVNELCAEFTKHRRIVPQACFHETIHGSSGGHSMTWMWLILIPIVIFIGIFAYIYFRRRAKRELSSELDTQIHSALSQYYVMTQK